MTLKVCLKPYKNPCKEINKYVTTYVVTAHMCLVATRHRTHEPQLLLPLSHDGNCVWKFKVDGQMRRDFPMTHTPWSLNSCRVLPSLLRPCFSILSSIELSIHYITAAGHQTTEKHSAGIFSHCWQLKVFRRPNLQDFCSILIFNSKKLFQTSDLIKLDIYIPSFSDSTLEKECKFIVFLWYKILMNCHILHK